MSNTFDKRAVNAMLGLSLRYRMTPAPTGVPAVGVVSTCGAGAWGAAKDLVAAGAITTEFWVAGICLDTLGAAQVSELEVTNATLASILWQGRFDPTAATLNMAPFLAGPYPVYCAALTQVTGRTGGAAAKVLGVSLIYAIGI